VNRIAAWINSNTKSWQGASEHDKRVQRLEDKP